MCHQTFHLGACRHMQYYAVISKMFFSIVLRKPLSNLHACNFAHVTPTHAVNVNAHLPWMDFTGCNMIHNSQHQLHEKHEQQLPQSGNL